MKLYILLLLYVANVLACTQIVNFNGTVNQYFIYVADESYEYQFTFIFDTNVTYEIGTIEYGTRSICKYTVEDNCHMNNNIESNIGTMAGNYHMINKDLGSRYNLTIESSCSKYQATPFSNIYYTCASSYYRPTNYYYYYNKIITILLKDYPDTRLTIELNQTKQFSDEQLSDTIINKCNKIDSLQIVEYDCDKTCNLLLLLLCIFLLVLIVTGTAIYKFETSDGYEQIP